MASAIFYLKNKKVNKETEKKKSFAVKKKKKKIVKKFIDMQYSFYYIFNFCYSAK